MKVFSGIVLCLSLLVCVTALARSAPGKGTATPVGGGSEPIVLGDGETDPGMIRGRCSLVEKNAKTKITTPCADLIVILRDAKGAELSRTRTSSKGTFKFSAEKGQAYYIGAPSDDYKLIEPVSPINGGDNVELKVQTRN